MWVVDNVLLSHVTGFFVLAAVLPRVFGLGRLAPERAASAAYVATFLHVCGTCSCVSWPVFLMVMATGLVTGKTNAHDVAGSLVLVTGASSGIGKEFALESAARGARGVVLVARRRSKLQMVADEIEQRYASTKAHVVVCDLTDPDGVEAMCELVTSKIGVPDVVVNNAGAGDWRRIEEETMQTAHFTTSCPYLSTFYVTRAFADSFLARGSGHFLNVTSAAAFISIPGAIGYATARAAVAMFTKTLWWELNKYGVGVTLLNALETSGTEYFDVNPQAAVRLPLLFSSEVPYAFLYAQDARSVAKKGLDGVQAGASQVNTPVLADWLMPLVTWLPNVLSWSATVGGRGDRKTNKAD